MRKWVNHFVSYVLSKAKKKRLIDEVEAAYKPHTTIKTNLKQHQDVLYYENGTNAIFFSSVLRPWNMNINKWIKVFII